MIKLKDVYKSFEKNDVLKGINLEVEDRETVVIVGKSGVGKSVLVKCIVGLIKPDKGEIWVDDVRIDKSSDATLNRVRKRFGYVFQYAALFDWMSVIENVMLPLVEIGIETSRAKEMAINALKEVGLEGVENKYPPELSGGMKKRVGIARAIVSNPDYLFYDEPTSGLDPYTSRLIYDLMEELNKHLSCTTIIITHDIELTRRFSERIIYLEHGKVLFDGPLGKAHSSPDFIEFLGNYSNYIKG